MEVEEFDATKLDVNENHNFENSENSRKTGEYR